MTVGFSSFDCLQSINDVKGASLNAAGCSLTSSSSSTMTNTIMVQPPIAPTTNTLKMMNSGCAVPSSEMEVPVSAPASISETSSSVSSNVPSTSSTTSNTTTITNTTTTAPNTHSMGLLKRQMRTAPPRSGRNHAGAKYLASQYTKGMCINN